MIPVVVAFAFVVLQSPLGTRMAIWCASWLAGATIVFTAGLFTFLHLWADAIRTTFTRPGTTSGADAMSVVRSVWSWDGLMLALAAAGVVAAFTNVDNRNRRLLAVTLLASALLVPIFQAAIGTGSWLLDVRMPAGTWFLAMGAGYAVATLVPLWRWKWVASVAALAVFLVYPAVTGTWYARSTFRSWPNVGTLVAQMRPLVGGDPGRILATTSNGTVTVLQYYLLHDDNWPRWQAVNNTVSAIETGNVSVIVLELNGSFNTADFPEGAAHYSQTPLASEILELASVPDQLSLIRELLHSPNYRIRLVITYNTDNPVSSTGVFAVWQRTATRG